MKNLKLSLALVIAVLAVGFTFATKASSIGNKQATGCFIDLTLQTSNASATYRPASITNQDCTFITSAINSGNFDYVQSANSTSQDPDCELGEEYCCVLVEPDPLAPATVPTITLGGVTAKFRVVEVHCFN